MNHADTIAYSLVEARALHELGVRNHGWYMTEAEHRGVLAALDALVVENQRLRDIEDKARSFVATTSYWRQARASRPEFEALAFALLALDGTPTEATT